MEPCYKLSHPIHLRDTFHIHISVNISVFPFFSLKDMYNSWDCDALLNYLNNVYFGSLVRTSCESCSWILHYLLLSSGNKGNWRQWISRNSFSQVQISFDIYTIFKLFTWYTPIHGLTSYLHYQKLKWCWGRNCWLFLVIIIIIFIIIVIIFSLRREKSYFVSP